MAIVCIGAVAFSIYSLLQGQLLNCFGYLLTALIPVAVWFSDDRDNINRDDKFQQLKEEVESYDLKVVENPEWIYAITDAEDKLLFGIHTDGTIDWGVGIPKPIMAELEALKKRISDLEKK